MSIMWIQGFRSFYLLMMQISKIESLSHVTMFWSVPVFTIFSEIFLLSILQVVFIITAKLHMLEP